MESSPATGAGAVEEMIDMRKRIAVPVALGAAALMAAAAAAPASAGVTGPAFYVDGEMYRTVLTPTDLSGTGAPASSFDTLYNLGDHQPAVAEAAPGDHDYNGGRWMVHAVSFPHGYDAALTAGDSNGNGVLDNDGEVLAAISAGAAKDDGVVKQFVCPVIKLPKGRA
jgi:hypothetical protein